MRSVDPWMGVGGGGRGWSARYWMNEWMDAMDERIGWRISLGSMTKLDITET